MIYRYIIALMKNFDNEEVIWTSRNKKLLLTTHRLRNEDKSLFGSSIQSMLLSELTYSELRNRWDGTYLKYGLYLIIAVNLFIFLLNNYLFEAELFKLFFNDVHMGPEVVGPLFYLTVIIGLGLTVLSLLSFRKVFSFYSGERCIEFQLRWLSFEERENFISLVEQTKELLKHRN